MSTASAEFQPPNAVLLYGEGLSNMSLQNYMRFVESMGAVGLTVTVPTQANAEADMGPSDEIVELFADDPLRLTDEQEFRLFADEQGFNARSVTTKTWHTIRRLGFYFPLTPRARALSSSRTDRAIFYFSPSLLTPELVARAHGDYIDFERGFDRHGLSDNRNDRSLRGIKNQANPDVHSLSTLVANGTLAAQPNIGIDAMRLVREFCAHALADGQ